MVNSCATLRNKATPILLALMVTAVSCLNFTITPSTSAYGATQLATGIMVPLYTYPSSTAWDDMVKVKTAYPSIPTIAIINPSNGPGSSKDSNYSSGIQKLQSAGIGVLGYVSTAYSSRSTTAIQADIDAYKSWYPSINGIFFDEMANWAGKEDYYKDMNAYAKSKGYTFTVGNPGADTISSYVGTVDNIIIYERDGVPALSYLTGWHTNHAKNNFSIIPYKVGSLDNTFVASSSAYVGYMFLTSDDLPNPWDSLPAYYEALASAVNSANASPPPTSNLYTVKVRSLNLAGNAVSGVFTTISKDGVIVKSGYLPLSFKAQVDATYQVTVSASNSGNTYFFDHWANGSTGLTRTINFGKDTTMTAYYKSGPSQVSVTIKSANLAGSTFDGMWTTVSEQGILMKTGYTSLSFSAKKGLSYEVSVADYQNYVFDHWEDGSKNRVRNVGPTNNVVMTAYYKN